MNREVSLEDSVTNSRNTAARYYEDGDFDRAAYWNAAALVEAVQALAPAPVEEDAQPLYTAEEEANAKLLSRVAARQAAERALEDVTAARDTYRDEVERLRAELNSANAHLSGEMMAHAKCQDRHDYEKNRANRAEAKGVQFENERDAERRRANNLQGELDQFTGVHDKIVKGLEAERDAATFKLDGIESAVHEKSKAETFGATVMKVRRILDGRA